MPIKSTRWYHFTSTRMAITKQEQKQTKHWEVVIVGKDVEKSESLCIVSWNVEWCSCCETSMNVPQNLNIEFKHQFSSVQFSRSVMSDSFRPHGLQHTRPPCPSPTPGVYPNPCPSSQWCHPTISSSVVPFFSCLQSFPASGSFPMSQLFASGGQSIGVSAST